PGRDRCCRRGTPPPGGVRIPSDRRLRARLRPRHRARRDGGSCGQPEQVETMLEQLASFLHRHRRRVLLVAFFGIGAAGVFGLGVANRLSPYGDTDPATQSVKATNRYQAASGRQIDPGVVALVRSRNKARVLQVEAQLRAGRDIAAVSSYYDSHDAATVSRDGRSTYVVAYFQPRSDSRIQDDAKLL